MQIKYVSFDLAEQSFAFHTQLEWHNLIANAREELTNMWAEEDDYTQAMDVEEVLEAYYGDEFFWEELPK